MKRDAQEREQPVSADHYRKRTGVLTNVIYDTAAVLQGKPIDGDWDTQSLFRMAERVVSRAINAESRVRELEISNARKTSLIGVVDDLITEIRKLEKKVEARVRELEEHIRWMNGDDTDLSSEGLARFRAEMAALDRTLTDLGVVKAEEKKPDATISVLREFVAIAEATRKKRKRWNAFADIEIQEAYLRLAKVLDGDADG